MGIRPDALLATLTLEQKVALLAGADQWHTVELPGVPAMRCTDGPAGARGTTFEGPRSASFPCGTALGATFDPDLVEEVGMALGREARSKGAHVLLAPTVNLHRTPIGGRNFECMSEDPTLTAGIASAYVRGVQSTGVAACIKHFVANDTEHERMTISSEVDERTLRELYLVPFEVAVRSVAAGGAGARAVMSSYNRINGTYASEHGPLLRGVLRDEWGFDGAVISDWHGTHSAAASLEAGLDLEMPGPAVHRGQQLLDAVRAGEVSEQRVDESVRRLLELFAATGVGEVASDETTDDSPETRDVIRRAGTAGMVLLKNDSGVLPLAASRVAVVGPLAERGQLQGGGSAQVRVNRPVHLLGALRDRGLDVAHAVGCAMSKRLPTLRGEFTIEFTDVAGEVLAARPVTQLRQVWFGAPAPGVPATSYGARLAGTFTPDVDGEWDLGLIAVGPAVLRVDGKVVVDLTTPRAGGALFGNASPEVVGTVELAAGRPVRLEVELGHWQHQMRAIFVGGQPRHRVDPIDDAVQAAAAAEVAIVVVGTDAEWETEGEDRTSMALPGRQDELVARVAAANPRTVVVVNAGSPVTMPWLDDVAAVLQIWFPGAELGNAVADVLLGVTEPGGRLPVTFPRRLADTPAYLAHPGEDGRAPYAEGLFIGYRWYDARELDPLFPFGHGLGYTSWTIEPVGLDGSLDAGVTARVVVRNTGRRAGSTVVQVYVSPPATVPPAGPRRAPRELRGFAKVALAPGESRTVEVRLDARAFAVWSVERHGWVVPPGTYEVLAGESSRSLASLGTVVVPASV